MKRSNYLKGFKWGNPKYARVALPRNDWNSALFEAVAIPANARVCVMAPVESQLVTQLVERLVDGFLMVLEFDAKQYQKGLRSKIFADKKRTALAQADPCALPSNIPKGPFDLLVAHRATERCQNQTRTISRYIRLIKEGGTVYSETAGEGDLDEVRKVADSLTGDPEFAPYFAGFRFGHKLHSKAEMEGLMVAAGYARYTINLRTEEKRVPAEEFAEWLVTYGAAAHAATLPKAAHESFAIKVMELLDNNDAGVLVKRSILSAEGKRMWGDLSHDLMNAPVGSL